MIAKIAVPVEVIDTCGMDYNAHIDNNTYVDMLYNSEMRSGQNVEYFMNTDNDERAYFGNDIDRVNSADTNMVNYATDVKITSPKLVNVDTEYLLGYVDSGNQLVLTLNINPNIDMDAQTELTAWAKESQVILEDKTINSKTILEMLPRRELYIIIDDYTFKLSQCSIVCVYSSKDFPYYYAVLCRKINQVEKIDIHE